MQLDQTQKDEALAIKTQEEIKQDPLWFEKMMEKLHDPEHEKIFALLKERYGFQSSNLLRRQ